MAILWRRAAIASLVTAPIIACSPAKTAPDPGTTKPTVTDADFAHSNEPIEVVLQRKAPGLQVTMVGGEIALQIRGSSSYNGAATPPLYILNGVHYTPGSGGVLSGINPSDIESIKLLRGAEAALYGINGANGVIEITTKKGGKP